MSNSTPSSVSRYRPAILVLTGAAAAFSAYLVYQVISSIHNPAAEKGLRRSNAVRRSNLRANRRSRQSRSSQVLNELESPPPLGEYEFFGESIELNARSPPTHDLLRQIASQAEPDATPEQVDYQITQLHDVFLDRFLRLTFPAAPLSTPEADATTEFLSSSIQNHEAITQALQRHASSFGATHTGDAAQQGGDAASLAGTEVLHRTLYHIAEDHARTEGVIHRGITCNGCDTKPIRGIRWHCANCHDFDLCSDCKATNSHIRTHVFYEIRVPIPNMGLQKHEPLYPGRPHAMPHTIRGPLKKRLVSETNMEAEEIEALYETFTCLAGTEWDADTSNVGYAMDRHAFNHAFIPRYSTFMATPNLIYDRIFAYYDSNHDGRIGFEEFVKGLDGMHSRDPKIRNKIVFGGYDIDGDGYISRKDVLRLFRAFYVIEQEATRNYLQETAEELSARGALDIINSSQPLGSAFTQSGIPGPLAQRVNNKSSGPVLSDDTDDVLGRESILRLTASKQDYPDATLGQYDEQAIKDRWERRQFYIDEEEGLKKPQDLDRPASVFEAEETIVDDDEVSPVPEQGRTRGSRSSSRVRFQDDVDFDARSNASTSSRPIGERWGGYEIPEPEKDLGREVLYQITQQGFNELLNPLFQEKEDNYMDACTTRAQREKLASDIQAETAKFKNASDLNNLVVHLGVFKYSKLFMDTLVDPDPESPVKEFLERMKSSDMTWKEVEEGIHNIFVNVENKILKETHLPDDWQPTGMQAWNANLCRLQLRFELCAFVRESVIDLEWMKPPSPPSSPSNAASSLTEVDRIEYKDPTMPQFRPNSIEDIAATTRRSEDPENVEDASADHTASTSTADSLADVIGSFKYPPVEYKPYRRNKFFIFYNGHEQLQWEIKAKNAESHDNAQVEPLEDPMLQPLPSPPPPPPPRDGVDTNPELDTESYQPFSNEPCLFLMWINPATRTICYNTTRTSHNTAMEKEVGSRSLERKLRGDATTKGFEHLLLPFLASLQETDKETIERGGPGLISLSEFEEKIKEGKLRFLECWIDWVSF